MGHRGTLCANLLPSLTSGHLTLQCEEGHYGGSIR